MSRLIVALVVGAFAAAAPSALAADVEVGQPGAGCDHPAAATLQAAVASASPHEHIRLCAGDFSGPVTIASGLDGLVIQGAGAARSRVLAPRDPAAGRAVVRVAGASGVVLSDLAIAGPGAGSCDSLEYGVRVDSGGSATLRHDAILDIRDQPLGRCANGVAVLAGRASEGTTGTVHIQDSVISGYQKGGVVASGAGSAAEVRNTVITGAGPTPTVAQNGVQIASGATGLVQDSTITGNAFTPLAPVGTGVLDAGAGAITVRNDRFSGDDVGVYLDAPLAPAQVTDNTISAAGSAGVYALGAPAGTQLVNEHIFAGAGDGIDLDGGHGVVVRDVQVSGGRHGIDLFDGATQSTVRNAQVQGVSGNGLYAEGAGADGPAATANLFLDDHAGASAGADCRDDTSGSGTAGTANVWRNDQGQTSIVAGLCGGAGPGGGGGSHGGARGAGGPGASDGAQSGGGKSGAGGDKGGAGGGDGGGKGREGQR